MKTSIFLLGPLTAALAIAQEPVQTQTQTQTFEQRVVMTKTGGEGPVTADFVYAFSPAMAASFDKAVKNAPYSADAVSETVQVLADGNRIVNQNSSQLARDSQGRTMRRDKLGAVGAVTAARPTEITFINDPVANVNWVLEAATKTARKAVAHAAPAGTDHVQVFVKVPRPGSDTPAMVYSQVTKSESGAQMTQFSKVMKAPQQADKTESLGKRTIEGLECEGSKSTLTIPAGQVGNERPIEIVSERWYSPELQTTIYSKRSDPRMGETTYKLTNVQRGEPSRLLFEIPSDYTVKESQTMVGSKPKNDE